jgi:hypothetical protein
MKNMSQQAGVPVVRGANGFLCSLVEIVSKRRSQLALQFDGRDQLPLRRAASRFRQNTLMAARAFCS